MISYEAKGHHTAQMETLPFSYVFKKTAILSLRSLEPSVLFTAQHVNLRDIVLPYEISCKHTNVESNLLHLQQQTMLHDTVARSIFLGCCLGFLFSCFDRLRSDPPLCPGTFLPGHRPQQSLATNRLGWTVDDEQTLVGAERMTVKPFIGTIKQQVSISFIV